jgi:hypothetical protein
MTKNADIKDWGMVKRQKYNVMLKKNSDWSFLDKLEESNLVEELGSIGINDGRSSVFIRFKQQFTKEDYIKLKKYYYLIPSKI